LLDLRTSPDGALYTLLWPSEVHKHQACAPPKLCTSIKGTYY